MNYGNYNSPAATLYSPSATNQLNQPFVPGSQTVVSPVTATVPPGTSSSTPSSVSLGGTSVPVTQGANGQYSVSAALSGANGQTINIDVAGSSPSEVAQAAQLAYHNASGVQAGSGNALLPDFGTQEPQGQPMPGVSSISVVVSDSSGVGTGVSETLNAQGATTHVTTGNAAQNSDGTYTATSTDSVLNGDTVNDASVTAGGATVTGTSIAGVVNTAVDNAQANDQRSSLPTVQVSGTGVTGVMSYTASGQGLGNSRTGSATATVATVQGGQVNPLATVRATTQGSSAVSQAASSASEAALEESQEAAMEE